ncbi:MULTISPECIES: DEAD/DEAH box helicase [Metabacillus]|uniref:DNA helicase n=2 Tax=Metabacillus TaxID=2675233 RepID=A0A179T368_9BACI|nr:MULTISPECIES: AAA domain-containing protein [Metabacillus]OAS88536.1 DNA helicase [Metabacillus litoralis]QNF30422.1 AAA family ATPase [Metabacillus sp. KUDC1714]
MHSTNYYIKTWQKALRAEIMHLKTYGSTKYYVKNGELMTSDGAFTYYFDTSSPIRIPVGSTIRMESGKLTIIGRILSSEGKSVIVSLEQSLGNDLNELFLLHDPWELLDQLHDRLDEIKESKRKRARIKRMMNPSNEAKHPTVNIKSNVHELVLRSKYNPVTFVWGPPGTGKTYTLGRVAANKYFKANRVLILSQSNQAVDVLMTEIARFIDKKGRFREGDLLRYGSQSAIASESSLTTTELITKRNPDLAKQKLSLQEERRLIKHDLGRSFSRRDSERLLEIEGKLTNVLEKIRQKEIQFVKDADIIGTTLSKAANDPTIYEKDYDLVIVDEASMAYVPQVGFAASLGSRVIICGDFKQLPPIAAARSPLVDEWLREDIFHKAGVVDWLNDGKKLHPHLFLLKEQRRMHPDISSFTNQYIYDSLVGDHESVKISRYAILERAPFPNRASVLLDSSFTGSHCLREKSSNSRFNLWQLLLSFQLIHESYLAGSRSIGYVTPYRAQAILMETLLSDLYLTELQDADITSATVHRFQGSERDVMLFDTVDSYPQGRPGMLLVGKDSERLINVAITRTRGKFIHICDHHFIQSNVYQTKTIRKLVDHQFKHDQQILPHQVGAWIKNQHPNLTWIHAKKLDLIIEDIHQARLSIFVGLPSGKELPKEWKTILNNRNDKVLLTFMTTEKIENVKVDKHINYSVSFPFIILDHQKLWLGLPVEATVNVRPPYVAARLTSKPVVDYFLSQLI